MHSIRDTPHSFSHLLPVDGAGAGGGKDDKKGRRHKYTAFKFEDDDEDGLPPGYVNPMSQTYGSDKDLKPASHKDDGWDPRQW